MFCTLLKHLLLLWWFRFSNLIYLQSPVLRMVFSLSRECINILLILMGLIIIKIVALIRCTSELSFFNKILSLSSAWKCLLHAVLLDAQAGGITWELHTTGISLSWLIYCHFENYMSPIPAKFAKFLRWFTYWCIQISKGGDTWTTMASVNGSRSLKLWKPSERVCSLHFLPTDFMQTTQRRTFHPDAVPSVFPCRPKNKTDRMNDHLMLNQLVVMAEREEVEDNSVGSQQNLSLPSQSMVSSTKYIILVKSRVCGQPAGSKIMKRVKSDK
jgi:hypothetical protein